jgi:anti-sigma B factor antagonist
MTVQIEARVLGDVVILDLDGEIAAGDGDQLLKDKINELVNQGHLKIVLNLAGVVSIDSASLGEFLRARATVTRRGGKLKLLNPNRRITDLLSLTKLLPLFEMDGNEDDEEPERTGTPTRPRRPLRTDNVALPMPPPDDISE